MELLDNLMAMGFTEYEAKVYLALLRASPATGYQLSKQAGIPRSMVYEALGRLYERGAALATDHNRGTLYRPLPPDVLLDRYEKEQRRLIQDVRDELDALHKQADEDRVWSIHGATAVRSYAAQMIAQARSEILLVANDLDLDCLREEAVAAHRRGARVSALLTGQGDLPCGRIARHPPLESELQQLGDDLIVVVDGREALVANTGVETTATVTRNRNLVLIARQFIWMELFTQRVSARLGADLLAKLDVEDRRLFEAVPDEPAGN